MNADQIIVDDFILKHPFAAAQSLDILPTEEIAAYFETLALSKIAVLFGFMDDSKATACFTLLSPAKQKELSERAEVSLLAALLKRMPSPQRNTLLSSVSSDRRAVIDRQLKILPNTVASIMENATVVTKKTKVADVLQLIKRDTSKAESYLYVVDVEGAFLGILRSKELILADLDANIEGLMITDVQSFFTDISVESILHHPGWQEFKEIPILDSSGMLIGKLPHRNLLKFAGAHDKTSKSQIAQTGSAIGELYRIGIAGLLQGSEK